MKDLDSIRHAGSANFLAAADDTQDAALIHAVVKDDGIHRLGDKLLSGILQAGSNPAGLIDPSQ